MLVFSQELFCIRYLGHGTIKLSQVVSEAGAGLLGSQQQTGFGNLCFSDSGGEGKVWKRGEGKFVSRRKKSGR